MSFVQPAVQAVASSSLFSNIGTIASTVGQIVGGVQAVGSLFQDDPDPPGRPQQQQQTPATRPQETRNDIEQKAQEKAERTRRRTAARAQAQGRASTVLAGRGPSLDDEATTRKKTALGQ